MNPKSPFVFVPVRRKHFARIEVDGIPAGAKAYDTLKRARRVKGLIMVVKRSAFKKGKVKPKHILNLVPYRMPSSILAGGGVVARRRAGRLEVIMIFRRGKWDLPKGKLDRGESLKECAVREVCEELGISKVSVSRKLGNTIHGYRSRKRRFAIKTTYWYLMRTKAKNFVPQAKERITDVRWVPIEDAIEMLDFKILRQLLSDNLDRIQLEA